MEDTSFMPVIVDVSVEEREGEEEDAVDACMSPVVTVTGAFGEAATRAGVGDVAAASPKTRLHGKAEASPASDRKTTSTITDSGRARGGIFHGTENEGDD